MRRLFLAVLAASLLVSSPRPLSGQVPRLTLTREIGCESCAGLTQFSTILDLSVDEAGRVMVLVGDAPMLRLFAEDGAPIWGRGTRGSGPGEFQRPIRAVAGPAGVQVVDMGLRRVTRLDGDGEPAGSSPIRGFPVAVAAAGRTGTFYLLIDDFRGGLTLERWTPGRPAPERHPLPPPSAPRNAGEIVFPALAASEGGIAVARDGNRYLIERLAPAGGAVGPPLARDLPNPQRSPEEIAALERRTARAAARARSERGGRAGPAPSLGDPSRKAQIAIDGLRFDDRGRLWVKTMRGAEGSTVFDLFSPAGAFLGELEIDGAVGAFSPAGAWLAVAVETSDGFPVVRRYRVADDGGR